MLHLLTILKVKLYLMLKLFTSQECLWNISGQIQGLLTTMEQRPEVVRGILLTCMIIYNMIRRHWGGADRPLTPADDIQPLQADQAANGPMRISETHRGRLNIIETNWKITSITQGHWLGWRKGFKKTGKTTSWHLSVLFRTTQLF